MAAEKSEGDRVQKIDYPNNGGPNPTSDSPRIETGAVQFGQDWPGYFIRGDNAAYLAMQINTLERALGLFKSENMTKEEFFNLVYLPMMEISGLKQGILGDTIVGVDTTAMEQESDWWRHEPEQKLESDESVSPQE